MSRLQITREVNVPRIESYLHAISVRPNQDIEIYDQITGASFGGEVALMQFFFTWAKWNPNGQLWLKTASSDEGFGRYIEKLSMRAFGFVAMLMADDVRSSDGESCRRLAYRACESWVDRVANTGEETKGADDEQSEDDAVKDALDRSVRGHRTFLPCVDRSTKATITPFYHANGQFRERSEFRRFAELLISRRSEKFVETHLEVFDGLGGMLYELMHNTHDWARTDIDGTDLRKSIRGVLFTRLYLPEASIRKAAGENAAIEEYMKTLIDRRTGQSIRWPSRNSCGRAERKTEQIGLPAIVATFPSAR